MIVDTNTADVIVENSGSITTLTPLSHAGRRWIEHNLSTEPWQWLGMTLAIDSRYADDIIDGMTRKGLKVA